MYLLELKRHGEYIYNGAIALAAQVYVLNNVHLDEPIIFPYISDPEIQVGRYQNILEEANLDYIEKNNLILVRRDTGGGTIYIDRGSVNFCFLANVNSQNNFENFDTMYQPVIKALNSLGVNNVEKSGRNDLVINNKKISGAAMTITKGKIYGGFSLLLDINEDLMDKVLKPNKKKMMSHSVKSVKSRVEGIRNHLSDEYKNITIKEFEKLILLKLFNVNDFDKIKKYELSDYDWQQIDKLMEEKYANWDWNFGASPRFEYNRDGRFKCGTIDISIEVEQGKIKNCKIYGDFFGNKPIEEIENLLLDSPLNKENLKLKLSSIDLKNYFGNISVDELVDLILS